MTEVFERIEQIVSWVKPVAYVAGGLAALLAVGVVTYVLHTTYSPLIRAVQWFCFYTPGEKPHPAFEGVSHGFRLAVWSVFLGLVLWLALHSIWR